MNIPDWWINATGLFAILGSVAMVALIILTGLLIWVSLDLVKQLKGLADKVEGLTGQVQGIATQVQDIAGEVQARTKTVGALVDDGTARAYGFVEKAAPLLVAAGIVFRLARATGFILGRRKKGLIRRR